MSLELTVRQIQLSSRLMERALFDADGWTASNGDTEVYVEVHVHDDYMVLVPVSPIDGDSIVITHRGDIMWVEPDGFTGLALVPKVTAYVS